MEKTIHRVTQKYYGTIPKAVTALGGGFYGRVFLAEITEPPYKIVLKIYLYNGLAERERLQLETLGKHALLPMPKVYFTHVHDEDITHDVLAMEFLEGVNAGVQKEIGQACREEIAEAIVNNLIAYHSVEHPAGFGDIGASHFEKDWRDLYRPKADDVLKKAVALNQKGQLDEQTLRIVQGAHAHFEDIFFLPITKACLIHGDYNTWNVMLDKDLTRAVACIDPFNCCWADPEFDLYQLGNANGPSFSLLDRYRKKRSLSDNFDLKNSFYELFTEIMHFHDAEVDLATSNIPKQARALQSLMLASGIV